MIDLQNSQSVQQIYINQAGIKRLKHPVSVEYAVQKKQATIAEFDITVSLASSQRGTHMSRFIEVLNGRDWNLSLATVEELLLTMVQKFTTDHVNFNCSFPLFINKQAPVSKVSGLVDYTASFIGKYVTNKNQTHSIVTGLEVNVPITTVCPCSKAISEYGAHNQRGSVKVTVYGSKDVYLLDIIRLVEQVASCELYSILKRPDEKYVTERAYENPKFVEDIVREIAFKLANESRFAGSYYKVECENFESIHNHSAYAMIEN